MSRFDSRLERLELKYLVSENVADLIRSDIESYCHGDSHNRHSGSSRFGYPITSLYLDTPNLAFHRSKERGDAERIKLRVRGYRPGGVAVLECKRRVSDVIDKTRASVDSKDVEAATRGDIDPGPSHPAAAGFFRDFASHVARSGAEPTLLIRYDREAWVSEVDHYARVTFDRSIEACRTRDWNLSAKRSGWVAFDESWTRGEGRRRVVLELKCQSQVPWWMIALIRKYALDRQSFSKYSIGIHLTGRAQGEDLLGRRSTRWMQ